MSVSADALAREISRFPTNSGYRQAVMAKRAESNPQERAQRASRKVSAKTKSALFKGLHRLLCGSPGTLPTIIAISKESGINAALITYHFGSKDELFMALLESILERRKEETRNLIEKDLPPIEKLKSYISGLVDVYFEHPYLTQLTVYLVSGSTPEIGERVSSDLVKPIQVNQEELLQQAIDAGLVTLSDAKFFYFMLLGSCERMFTSRFALAGIFGINQVTPALKQSYAEYVEHVILHGIIKADGSAATTQPMIEGTRKSANSRRLRS